MSAEPRKWLGGVNAEIRNVEVVQEEDTAGVVVDVEQSDRTEFASPVAESVKSARKNLQDKENTTVFDLYDEMLDLDPELSGAVRAISHSASNYDIVLPTDDPTDDDLKALKHTKELERRLELPLTLTDILKKLVAHGNDINKKVYNEDEGIIKLQNLPTNAITIVESEGDIITGEDEHDTSVGNMVRRLMQRREDKADVSSGAINEVFSRGLYVLNEATGDVTHRTIKPENIIHFSVDERSNWFTDVMDRETYGVWGQSRLEPLTFTIQTKYNTLTNKVAMDDSLLAREIYYIDTESLFGDIQNRKDRKKAAEKYAKQLKRKIEQLGPDERPMLPEEVNVEVIGPEGKAIDQTPFLEQLNHSIAAALTFPMAGLGRGTTSVKAGEEISSLWAENNIKNLRTALTFRLEELFKENLLLLEPDWRKEDVGGLDSWELKDDITVPTIEFEPFREEDLTEIVSQIKGMVSVKAITLKERREMFGLPTDEESIENVIDEYGDGSPLPGDGVSSNDPDPEGISRDNIPEEASTEVDEVDE